MPVSSALLLLLLHFAGATSAADGELYDAGEFGFTQVSTGTGDTPVFPRKRFTLIDVKNDKKVILASITSPKRQCAAE